MEEMYIADRSRLRALRQAHPTWTHAQYAADLGRSEDFVKKWLKRLAQTAIDDETALKSHGRAPQRRAPWDEAVITRILEIRDQPPENLRRTPGPVTILYFLQRDEALRAAQVRLPRSTRTVWRILHAAGRIVRVVRHERDPIERPAPLDTWQLDFKDASTVPADPEGKRQHVVEVLNVVDAGTSILLGAQANEDYRAQTVLPALVPVLEDYGLPDCVMFDRDPRFVGSPQGRDFPSPFVRFWQCLGVNVAVCPPRRPDKNCFVERYHRSYTEECLRLCRPTTLADVREVTTTYREHYNWERPNQALSCQNRPPRTAFPHLPPRPGLPLCVDPDRWVACVHGQAFARKVRADGCVSVDDVPYYLGHRYAGQRVALQVDAPHGAFLVHAGSHVVLTLPIKGLQHRLFTFEEFVAFTCAEACARESWTYRAAS